MKFGSTALSVFLAAAAAAAAAEESPPPTPPPIVAPAPSTQKDPPEKKSPDETALSSDDLYSIGKTLFDSLAPAEIKEEYEFISRDAWTGIMNRLESALASGSLEELAACAPLARQSLEQARALPEAVDLIAWLEERLDLAEAAELLVQGVSASPVATPPPSPTPTPTRRPSAARPPETAPTPTPAGPMATAPSPPIPHFEWWKERLAKRPMPSRAAAFMPTLKAAFAAEGVPAVLVWLAEVESAFNPTARSPVGAKGLFQLMPATAEELGLSTFLPDERTQPLKSAQAAARLLRTLHARFSDWPLALAAYNAGEGRVRRALAAHQVSTFADVSAQLPSETQLYVPKVLATVLLREGVSVEQIPAPAMRH